MNIQVQPNNYSCLPTALAILLNESVEDIIKEIGDHHEQNFHIQELNKICIKRGKALIEFDITPKIYLDNLLVEYHFDDTAYVEELMKSNDGILLGQTKDNKNHAVAWNYIENCIYDPNGTIYARGFFDVESFLVLVDMRNRQES